MRAFLCSVMSDLMKPACLQALLLLDITTFVIFFRVTTGRVLQQGFATYQYQSLQKSVSNCLLILSEKISKIQMLLVRDILVRTSRQHDTCTRHILWKQQQHGRRGRLVQSQLEENSAKLVYYWPVHKSCTSQLHWIFGQRA
jgi:hypothetical protein